MGHDGYASGFANDNLQHIDRCDKGCCCEAMANLGGNTKVKALVLVQINCTGGGFFVGLHMEGWSLE